MPTLSKSVAKELLSAPIRLAPNTYLHFYNGGKLRAEFMGEDNPKDDYYSEEWIFSTNRAITPGRENPPDKGLSRIELPSGEKELPSVRISLLFGFAVKFISMHSNKLIKKISFTPNFQD